MFDIKILIGGLQQEVNSFAPGKTGIAEYSRRTIYWGQDLIDRLPNYTRRNDGMDSFAAAYRVLKEAGATVVSCGCMAAQPGAIIEQSIIDNYIEHVKQATRENLPLDGVVLFLHGAAQSEGSDDPEGDIIVAIREIVGENVPITVRLDMHANVTERMVKNSNAISLFHRYPHIDMWETGERAARLCVGIVKGEISPKMAYVQIPMIVPASSYTTETEPFRSLMAKGHEYVKSGKLLDFSISQMQPWLDVKDGYSSTIAISEDADVAAEIAKELATDLWNMRHEFKTELTSVDEIIKIAENNESGKPVILNDFADSSRAGSSGDSPEVIERILALSSDVRGLMYLNDSVFVEACRKAGVGNTVVADLGASIATKLYTPVRVEAKVKALFDGLIHIRGAFVNLGPSAIIQIRNTIVIVTTQHRFNGDPRLYQAFGYDPTAFQMVVVKACTSFRAFYGPLTDLIYPADTKGVATSNLLSLPYEKIPKTFYPFTDGSFTPAINAWGK